MLDRGRIGSVQLLFLLLIFDGATSFLYAPSPTTKVAGRDSWLAIALVPTLYAALVVLVALPLARRFPNRVLTEYIPEITGKALGKPLAAAYAAFFILLTSAILCQAAFFVQIAILRETPPIALGLILSGVAAYGAYLGIEVIARENEMVWPLWTFSIIFLGILALKDLNLLNLKPFLENGAMPVLRGGLPNIGYRGEVFLLLMLFPYLSWKEEAAKAASWYIMIAMLFHALALSITIGVFGDAVTSHMLFPYYELARYISIAQFFERFQSLIVVIWIAGTVIKLAGFLHTCSIAAATTVSARDYRPLLFPVTALALLGCAFLHRNYLKMGEVLFKQLPYISFIFQLLIPGTLLLLTCLRLKEERGKSR
ncbi:MAG: GerAB/ArcD/ProY family transporter [Thermacetogeniaceae bacterium]